MKAFKCVSTKLTLFTVIAALFCLFYLPAIAFAASPDDQPNSWRYKNGQLLNAEEESVALQSEATLQANVVARGIDVSEWQGDINWQAVKNSGQVDFAIIRCGFAGTDHDRADYKWERNVSECERLGIPYGVYVYSYASNWDAQNSLAQKTKNWIGSHKPSYPVFIDMEDSSIANCGRDTLTSFVKSFCQQMENAGFVGGVYSNTNWYNNVLYGDQLDNYVKWVAQWNTTCTYGGNYAMWQYTSKGSVPGISGNVDMNYLYKEVAVNESRFKGVYDYDFYAENNPDVARAYGTNHFKTLMHFITYGMKEHRQASVTFNYDYYWAANKDLQNAFGSDASRYYNHFIEYGMNEGRNGSEMFDFSYYKAQYGDLQKAFAGDNKKYYHHFLNYGMSEGRRGSSSFSLEGYFNRNRDLRTAFAGNLKRYYSHYVIYGKNEGRQASECSSLQSALTSWSGVNYSHVYDANYYVNKYWDLKKAFSWQSNYCTLVDDTRLMEHFFECGMNEARQAKDSFQIEAYYNRYWDLRVAFRGNLREYYKHYIQYGKNEGRETLNCSTLQNPISTYGGVNYSLVYDANYYVNKYSDLKKAFSWPSNYCTLVDDTRLIEHFWVYGMNEGRQAKESFDKNSYYNEYPDLRAAFGKNWKSYYLHYIQYGHKEGRNTTGCTSLKG